jgi:carbonic anhydrase
MRRRENFGLAAVVICAVIVAGAIFWRPRQFAATLAPTEANAALAELRSGNSRFVHSARMLSTDTDHDAEHRHLTAQSQHPFVVMLCCSDSRVCPEFIFDQRAGSIFEIRNAGNVVDEDVLASFEYAVEHLHVPLILVLAHKGCGAIEAVCEAGDEPLHDHLQELQRHMAGIHQQVMESQGDLTPERLARLSKENARQQALTLMRDSPVLRTAVEESKARLVSGIYDMETGTVDFFDPEQTTKGGD